MRRRNLGIFSHITHTSTIEVKKSDLCFWWVILCQRISPQVKKQKLSDNLQNKVTEQMYQCFFLNCLGCWENWDSKNFFLGTVFVPWLYEVLDSNIDSIEKLLMISVKTSLMTKGHDGCFISLLKVIVFQFKIWISVK